MGYDFPQKLFFTHETTGRSAHVASGARGIVEAGRRPREARQEGSTDGECSTHTPPAPNILKMHF